MKRILTAAITFSTTVLFFARCTDEKKSDTGDIKPTVAQFGAYDSQVKWGEHLVKVGGCNDCHTPKKMGANGPENDMSLMLSGHPSQMPPADFDPKEAAKKNLIITQTFTSWTWAALEVGYFQVPSISFREDISQIALPSSYRYLWSPR